MLLLILSNIIIYLQKLVCSISIAVKFVDKSSTLAIPNCMLSIGLQKNDQT